jgi:hypothetical protein
VSQRARPTASSAIQSVVGPDRTDLPNAEPTSALVLAPVDAPGERQVCGGLLSAFSPVNVLGVALRHGDAHFADLCREFMTERPSDIGVVDVGGDGTGVVLPDEAVSAVSEPGDLTGTGIRITNHLRSFPDEAPTVACFDSLTPLLQFVDLERCYRFLELTTGRLDRVCAVSHAHLDPNAHDDRTVETITQVFDTVIEPAGEVDEMDAPDWTVRTT